MCRSCPHTLPPPHLQYPGATSYMGCIGDDEFGRKMSHVASQDGVNVSPSGGLGVGTLWGLCEGM